MVRDFDSKMQDIILDVNKHDNLVNIHEELLRGKGSQVDENYEGHPSDGFYVAQPMHIISRSDDKDQMASFVLAVISDNVDFL